MSREPGDKLIPKLIPVIRDTIIATKKGLAGHERDVRAAATQKVIDRAGHEIADLYRPILDKLLAQGADSLSPEVRQFLEDAKSGEHQLKAFSGLLLGPVSGALGLIISNELAPLVYSIVGANPNLDLDPQSAANAAAQGIVTEADAANSAHQQGFSLPIFQALLNLAIQPPDASTIQTLVNRGMMTEQQALHWLRRSAYSEDVAPLLFQLKDQILSPADLALAVLRGNMEHEAGVEIAAANGLNAADFEVLIGNTGEPPGVMDMLSMHRRRIITQEQLVHGILQSRVRNEWIPALLGYQFEPMSTADAIDATVQNHLTIDQARQIALLNGLEASAFDPLVQTAGEPLSKTEMLRLHRMGKATAEQVKQALRESRLKDKYVDQALELSVQIPPLFTIRSMVTSGAITDALATELLHEDGYQPDIIKAIIRSAHKQKTPKVKELTEGMLSSLYEERAITAETFESELVTHGYSKAEAAQIRQLDDWRILKNDRDVAISHLRSMFVGHKIDSAKVQAELNALQVPSDMRDKLIADWTLEAEATVRDLTYAQIVAAWKISIFDTPTALARLVDLGYSGEDAGTILEIANKGPLGG